MSNIYAQNLTGLDIMKKNDALKRADTAQNNMEMIIYRGSRRKIKRFNNYIMEQNNDDRFSYIKFLYPTKIKFLSKSYHDSDDSDRWLKLTSGRARRIVAKDKGKPFVNSHFAYEDLERNYIDQGEYKLIKEESVNGEECYKIEVVKKKKNTTSYSKRVVYISKKDYFLIKAEFYNKKKKLHKIFTVDKREVSKQGVIVPLKMTMIMKKNPKFKTELYTKKYKLNIKLNKNMFTPQRLK